jgi:hypothetical protein
MVCMYIIYISWFGWSILHTSPLCHAMWSCVMHVSFSLMHHQYEEVQHGYNWSTHIVTISRYTQKHTQREKSKIRSMRWKLRNTMKWCHYAPNIGFRLRKNELLTSNKGRKIDKSLVKVWNQSWEILTCYGELLSNLYKEHKAIFNDVDSIAWTN